MKEEPGPRGEPTRHRVSVRFSVPGLWVHPDGLGAILQYQKDQCDVVIALPARPDDFMNADEPEVVRIPSLSPAPGSQTNVFSINTIQVEVSLDGEGSTQDKRRLDPNTLQRVIGPSWDKAYSCAEREILHFLSWFRVSHRQPWLGLAEQNAWQYGRAHIFDAETGERLFSYGPKQIATLRFGQLLAAKRADIELLQEPLASGREVPTSSALLADALFLVEETETVDAHRAILAAAMACEIRIKHALRSRSNPETQGMVNLVLRGKSDIGVLASSVAKAVSGRSLKDENPELFSRLQALASIRNRVVHEGASVRPLEARPLVAAASQTFDWLDQLTGCDPPDARHPSAT